MFRTGPGYVEFTALLNNMRVYLILDWLMDVNKYLLENPNQERCDSLRAKTAQLMARFSQVHSGEQRKLDSVSIQLLAGFHDHHSNRGRLSIEASQPIFFPF